jgi:hypothetical protein
MTAESLYRLHTDALDRRTLKEIANRILQRNPNQKVYIYDIERDEDEVEMLKDALHKAHDPDCECGQCTGEDRALELMEKGIVEAETSYRE